MFSKLEINQSALLHNAQLFSQRLGHKHFAPVLKSNAYGHGLKEVYKILATTQPEWLCVNYAAEGTELRTLGYKGRILVVGPLYHASHLTEAAEQNLDLNISNFEALKAWLGIKNPPSVHLKFDTGLSRQGFSIDGIETLAKKIKNSPVHLAKCVGVYTHFANVEDVQDYSYAFRQLTNLEQCVQQLQANGIPVNMIHAASSASSLLLEQSRFHLSRVGMSLYGHWPSDSTRLSYFQSHGERLELKPVLSWRTEVAMVRDVPVGDHIGYGCQYKVMRPMRIAVLPVGYFEGYPRLAGSSQSYVLIDGKRCQLVGRICMNMMMVDVTHLDNIVIGAPVTLIGSQGSEKISAETLAGWAETIQYELLSRLHADIPRVIV